MELVLDETFSNLSNWIASDGTASDGLGTFRAANAYVENGELVMRVDSNYDSVRLRSVKTYTHGRFECECRVDSQPGSWSAFWLWHETQDPQYYECDFEWRGNYPTTVRTGHIYQSSPKLDDGKDVLVTWADGQYHTWRLDLDESALTMSLDGTQIDQYTTNINNVPQNIMFDHKVGGAFAGPPDGNTVYPFYMRMRRLRVWQADEWRGYARLQYPGLSGGQETAVQNALANVGCRSVLPNVKTHYRRLATGDWVVECAGNAQPATDEWIDMMAYALNTAIATVQANLTVTTYAGSTWDERRAACKAALGL